MVAVDIGLRAKKRAARQA